MEYDWVLSALAAWGYISWVYCFRAVAGEEEPWLFQLGTAPVLPDSGSLVG